MTDIALFPARRLEKLTGYYVADVEGKSYIYAVNYWIANIDATDDVGYFIIPNTDIEVKVPKHIQLGSMVYTCVNGRGKRVRNAIELNTLPGIAIHNAENTLMAMGAPFLTKSKITNMEDVIAFHNSIYYPPRFSIISIKEPYIYSQLYKQQLDTLSYPWRNEFLDSDKSLY